MMNKTKGVGVCTFCAPPPTPHYDSMQKWLQIEEYLLVCSIIWNLYMQ